MHKNSTVQAQGGWAFPSVLLLEILLWVSESQPQFCPGSHFQRWEDFVLRPVNGKLDQAPLSAEGSGTDSVRWTLGSPALSGPTVWKCIS